MRRRRMDIFEGAKEFGTFLETRGNANQNPKRYERHYQTCFISSIGSCGHSGPCQQLRPVKRRKLYNFTQQFFIIASWFCIVIEKFKQLQFREQRFKKFKQLQFREQRFEKFKQLQFQQQHFEKLQHRSFKRKLIRNHTRHSRKQLQPKPEQ